MDLKLSNKINTLVIHVMQNQIEDLIFLYLVFFWKLSSVCDHFIAPSEGVFLQRCSRFVPVQPCLSHCSGKRSRNTKNEHVKNVKWTGKSKEVFERRQRQRAEVIVGTETLLPSTGWQQNWNRKEWTCLICALYMWCALCLCSDHSPIKEISPTWTITFLRKLQWHTVRFKSSVKIYDSKSNFSFALKVYTNVVV